MGLLGTILGGVGGFLLGGPTGASIGASLGGSIDSSNAQTSAGNAAADAQVAASQAGIAEQRRQFDAVQKLLAPYVQAGTGSLTAQQNLIGLGGAGAQQQAIDQLQAGPQFQSMLKAGTNSILQNASATGGLRGGNTQGALAAFAPSLLAQVIQQQFGNLGGLTTLGENAAAGVGNAGLQTGNAVSSLLQQGGAAQSGGYLNAGKSNQNLIGGALGSLGQLVGQGGGNGGGGLFGFSLKDLINGTGLGGGF